MPEIEIKTYTLGECKIALIYIIIGLILAIIGSIYLAVYAEYASIFRSLSSFLCNVIVIFFIGSFIAGFCGEKNKALVVAIAAIVLQLLGFSLFVTIKNAVV